MLGGERDRTLATTESHWVVTTSWMAGVLEGGRLVDPTPDDSSSAAGAAGPEGPEALAERDESSVGRLKDVSSEDILVRARTRREAAGSADNLIIGYPRGKSTTKVCST